MQSESRRELTGEEWAHMGGVMDDRFGLTPVDAALEAEFEAGYRAYAERVVPAFSEPESMAMTDALALGFAERDTRRAAIDALRSYHITEGGRTVPPEEMLGLVESKLLSAPARPVVEASGPGCKVCGDEKILMEPDGSKAQPCYACQPAGTTLEQASRPYAAVVEASGDCTCKKPTEGMLGWDRSMVNPDCPKHGCLRTCAVLEGQEERANEAEAQLLAASTRVEASGEREAMDAVIARHCGRNYFPQEVATRDGIEKGWKACAASTRVPDDETVNVLSAVLTALEVHAPEDGPLRPVATIDAGRKALELARSTRVPVEAAWESERGVLLAEINQLTEELAEAEQIGAASRVPSAPGERPERWMVDYEHGEGEPQHTVLSWLDDEAKGLPDVGEYLIRESDAYLLAAPPSSAPEQVERAANAFLAAWVLSTDPCEDLSVFTVDAWRSGVAIPGIPFETPEEFLTAIAAALDAVPGPPKGMDGMCAYCGSWGKAGALCQRCRRLSAKHPSGPPESDERLLQALRSADTLVMAANGALGRAKSKALPHPEVMDALREVQARLAAISDVTLTALSVCDPTLRDAAGPPTTEERC